MIEFLTIVAHQIIFQGMFILKNAILRRETGKQIRGKNIEATVSIFFFAFFIIAAISISYFNFGNLHILSDKSAFLTGLGILVINLILSAFSLIHLKDSWRVGVIENQKTKLVTNGVYSITRNPYFVSYFLMFASYTVLLQSLILLVLSLAGFILVHTMIVKEERYLLAVHGDKYLQYKLKVPRYLII